MNSTVAIPLGTPCRTCGLPLSKSEDEPVVFYCMNHEETHVYHYSCLTDVMKEALAAHQKAEASQWN